MSAKSILAGIGSGFLLNFSLGGSSIAANDLETCKIQPAPGPCLRAGLRC